MNNLIGLKVKLDRPVDREHPCCRNICVIGAGEEPHAGALQCAGCGRRRGWISKSTARWIGEVATCFGAPSALIVLRKSHTHQEEEPDTEPN